MELSPSNSTNSLDLNDSQHDSHMDSHMDAQLDESHHANNPAHPSKRRFTAVVCAGNFDDIDNGPNSFRLSRRYNRISSTQLTEADMLETMAIKEMAPDRLLATKRILAAFNAGDIDAVRNIVYDTALDICEVYFTNVSHVFVGKSALFSLWNSLFEAFPNGVFRPYESVINEKKQVNTTFLFFGTKIFPLLIDGQPVEILPPINPDPKILANFNPNNCVFQNSSVKVDTDHLILSTEQLSEQDQIPEMVFEGRIILHMNDQCRIRKFEFNWNRKL